MKKATKFKFPLKRPPIKYSNPLYSVSDGGDASKAEVTDGNPHVHTITDGKCLCPDRHRRKGLMSRRFCVDFQTFVRSPDFRALIRLWRVRVQTFMRSREFCPFVSRRSCVHQNFVRSPEFRAFTFRLLSVHQNFVRSRSDF